MIRRAVMAGLVLVLAAPLAAQTAAPVNDAPARQALDAYGRCVAEREAGESARVLALDFRTPQYRTGLKLLADEARQCARGVIGSRDAMRSSNLLFAGAVAESLLEQGPDAVNVRLVRAAATPLAPFGASDAVAQCLARSVPDQVGTLFAAMPGSAEEAAAISALDPALVPCVRAAGVQSRFEASAPGLRAMIATAAFRLVNQAEITGK